MRTIAGFASSTWPSGVVKKDSFPQRLKEFIEALVETKFRLVLRCDVTGPAADSRGDSLFGYHLNPAIEVAKLARLLQAQRETSHTEPDSRNRGSQRFASSRVGDSTNSSRRWPIKWEENSH